MTYEVQDRRDGESFSRLRVVPAGELNADALAEANTNENSEPVEREDGNVIESADGEELTLVDDKGKVIARSNRETIDDSARQTLTPEEIEELKSKGTGAGKDLIAKLLLSHTAIEQKTAYSLAKYKLLKTKKYIRWFTVLPLDVPLLGQWLLEDRDAGKVLEFRAEMMALVGCWADVHWSGPLSLEENGPHGGRWLTVDDTGGLLVAVMAERMGILYQDSQEDEEEHSFDDEEPLLALPDLATGGEAGREQSEHEKIKIHGHIPKRPHKDDFEIHYAPNNTITVLHSNTQPNLANLRYFGFDSSDPNPPFPYHPLFTNLLPISWLQLLVPEEDPPYSEDPLDVDDDTLMSWKTNKRGNYHRKRRRWARTRHIVDNTRAGGFSGLAVASTMDPISVLRHTLPLLAGGSPVAIYSQSAEPLTALVDCFSLGRRAAWISTPPVEAQDKTPAELVKWEGTPDFPLNPTLLLGAGIQTSKARRWQVLPGRTHPFMTGKGGAEGYLFTGWRALPVGGKVSARGKFTNKRKSEAT